MKEILNLLVFMWFSVFAVAAYSNQEVVHTEGSSYAETKMKACEKALDIARQEAAQSATSLVESKFLSHQNDRGVALSENSLITSKAFAKLIKKREETSYDPETGMIRCTVFATFKAGFVVDSKVQEPTNISTIKEQKPLLGSKTTEQVEKGFRAGKPVCSEILNACFREVYVHELNKFGIQVVAVGGMNPFLAVGDFFDTIEFPRHAPKNITTLETFFNFVNEEYADVKKSSNRVLTITTKGYRFQNSLASFQNLLGPFQNQFDTGNKKFMPADIFISMQNPQRLSKKIAVDKRVVEELDADMWQSGNL